MGNDKTYSAHLIKEDETRGLAEDEAGIVLHDVNECGWTLHYRNSDGVFRKVGLTAGSLISMSPYGLTVQADLARALELPKIATLFSENFEGPSSDVVNNRTVTRTTEAPYSHYMPGLSNLANMALNDRIKEAREVYERERWLLPADGNMNERAALAFGASCILSAGARHLKEVDDLEEQLLQQLLQYEAPWEIQTADCRECGTSVPSYGLSSSGLCGICWSSST